MDETEALRSNRRDSSICKKKMVTASSQKNINSIVITDEPLSELKGKPLGKMKISTRINEKTSPRVDDIGVIADPPTSRKGAVGKQLKATTGKNNFLG